MKVQIINKSKHRLPEYATSGAAGRSCPVKNWLRKKRRNIMPKRISNTEVSGLEEFYSPKAKAKYFPLKIFL